MAEQLYKFRLYLKLLDAPVMACTHEYTNIPLSMSAAFAADIFTACKEAAKAASGIVEQHLVLIAPMKE